MTCLLESLSLEVSLSHVGVHSTLRFIAVTFAFSFAFTLLEELALSLLAIVVLLNLATLIVMSTQDLDLLVKRKEKSSRLVPHRKCRQNFGYLRAAAAVDVDVE
jgi:hypothetical protein